MWNEILHRSWLRLELYYHFNDSQNVLNVLKQAYAESQRAYHTLQHINECLFHFEQVQDLLEDARAVELALWFHDAVYNPKASDNEACSATLFQDLLKDDLSTALLAKISQWIIATKQHFPSSDQDLNLLLDIDLAILGATSKRFIEYQQQIQCEYDWVDSEIYQHKRKQVLTHFFLQQPLYQTTFFQDHFELQAKQNLTLALAGNLK